MKKLRCLTIPSAGEDVKQPEQLNTAGRNLSCFTPFWKITWNFLVCLKTGILPDI